MKAYIVGKINGDPNYKAKFDALEERLKAIGAIVIKPSVLPEGMRPANYMRICMAMIDSADIVYFMPDCWQSKGATLELNYCRYIEKATVFVKGEDV